jgi:hypothetical protein
LNGYDLKRLDAYSKNIIDYHAVIDLVPVLSNFVFGDGLSESLTLSAAQFCILLGVGLQFKTLEEIAVCRGGERGEGRGEREKRGRREGGKEGRREGRGRRREGGEREEGGREGGSRSGTDNLHRQSSTYKLIK